MDSCSQVNSQQNIPMGSQTSPIKRPIQTQPMENIKRMKTSQDQMARRHVQNSNPIEIRPSGTPSHTVASFKNSALPPSPSLRKLNGVISISDEEAKIINSGGYVNYSHPPPKQFEPTTSQRDNSPPRPTVAKQPPVSPQTNNYFPYTNPVSTPPKQPIVKTAVPSPAKHIPQTNARPPVSPNTAPPVRTTPVQNSGVASVPPMQTNPVVNTALAPSPPVVPAPVVNSSMPMAPVATNAPIVTPHQPSPIKAPMKANLPPSNVTPSTPDIKEISGKFLSEIEELKKEIVALKSREHSLVLENEKLSDELLLSQEQIAMSQHDAIIAKQELEKKDPIIKDLLQQIGQNSNLLESTQQKFSEKVHKIESLEQQIHQKDLTIDSLRNELKNRENMTEMWQKEKDLILQSLQKQSAQKDSVIQSLQETLNRTSSEKDKVIVELREKLKKQENLQEEFMIESYGSCFEQSKEARQAELESRLLETFRLLEKLKNE